MKMELVKSYRRKNKVFFVVRLINDNKLKQGPRLRSRVHSIKTSRGQEHFNPSHEGISLIDFTVIEPNMTIEYKIEVDAEVNELLKSPGTYILQLGVVKESVAWYAHLPLELEVRTF